MYTSFTLDDIEGHILSLGPAGGKTTFTITDMVEGRVLPWGYPDVCFIISDSQFENMSISSAEVVTYKAYSVDHQQTTKEASAALMGMKTEKSGMSTYYSQYRQNVETSVINVFTLGFLGLVFLVATGSIIYFKQLTEAESDKSRYDILRKIGVSKIEIRNSIAKQVLFAFVLPLSVGILHSAMMLQALASINLIEGLFAAPIMIAVGAYIPIYLVYYILTVNSYNRIVNS